jgi:hypothetical protein
MRIIILFALCRYAHYYAFISVIELPRIPAYCPKSGGIASMFVGTFATIALEVMGHPFGLATILVAVPVSFLTLIVVSLLTQKENQAAA